MPLLPPSAAPGSEPVAGDDSSFTPLARQLLDAVQDVVFILDYPSMRIAYCNQPAQAFFAEAFGLDHPEGRSGLELVDHPRERIWEGFIAKAVNNGTHEEEYRRGISGRRWRLHLRRQPASGPARAIAVTCHDLTAIETTREELAHSEHRYGALFAAMGTGVVFQGRDGHLVGANPAAERILGRPLSAMLGMTPDLPDWAAVREDGTPFPAAEHPAMLALRTGQPQEDVVMGIRRPDGSRRWLSVNARPVEYGRHGRVDMVVNSFHDVTETRYLQQQLKAQVQQLDRALEQSLAAMAELIEMRDPYTAGHQRKVAALAHEIAREMGLDDARCQLVRMAAMVHDIGKNAVPLELLVKPSRLTDLEREIIKQHVDAGYRTLLTIEFAAPVAEIVRQHHERLDGSGYPLGLRGEAIGLEARIIAVADTVDAMSAHRPYRPSLGMAAAMAELDGQAGVRYDADVVRAFHRTLERA